MTNVRRPWETGTEQENTQFLEAALEAAGRGWAVFPLAPNGKVPLLRRNWQELATTDPDTIRDYWRDEPNANIGIATGQASGVSVVDVDIKDGRAGEANAIKLGLTFFDTHTVRTASGGWHYYFAHPDGFRNRAGILEGIDTRGDGGYVVGEGSIIDGEPYDLANVGDVQEMPDSVMRLVGTRQDAEGAKPDGPVFEVQDDEVKRVRAALGYLDAEPYEIWLNVGMALYELGGGSEQMFALWDHWSAGAPNYDGAIMAKRWQTFASDRGDKITESTFWYMAREAGYTDPDVDMIFVPEKASGLFFNNAELEQWREPRLEDIELWRESVISRGNMTLIAGPPKVGKSLFVQHLLMAAATGREFLGHPFARPLRVAWLQAEIRKVYLKLARIRPALESAKLSTAERRLFDLNFFMTDRADLEITRKREFDILAQSIAQVKPDILVVDPIINFSSADENSSNEAKDLLRAARQLARAGSDQVETEPALVLIHHTRKGDGKKKDADPFDAIRGSGAFRGYYDSGVMLLPDPSGARALHFETRNQISPESLGVRYNSDLAVWEMVDLEVHKTPDGAHSAIHKGESNERILQILAELEFPHWIARNDLVKRVIDEGIVGRSQAYKVVQDTLDVCAGMIGTAGRKRANERIFLEDYRETATKGGVYE